MYKQRLALRMVRASCVVVVLFTTLLNVTHSTLDLLERIPYGLSNNEHPEVVKPLDESLDTEKAVEQANQQANRKLGYSDRRYVGNGIKATPKDSLDENGMSNVVAQSTYPKPPVASTLRNDKKNSEMFLRDTQRAQLQRIWERVALMENKRTGHIKALLANLMWHLPISLADWSFVDGLLFTESESFDKNGQPTEALVPLIETLNRQAADNDWKPSPLDTDEQSRLKKVYDYLENSSPRREADKLSFLALKCILFNAAKGIKVPSAHFQIIRSFLSLPEDYKFDSVWTDGDRLPRLVARAETFLQFPTDVSGPNEADCLVEAKEKADPNESVTSDVAVGAYLKPPEDSGSFFNEKERNQLTRALNILQRSSRSDPAFRGLLYSLGCAIVKTQLTPNELQAAKIFLSHCSQGRNQMINILSGKEVDQSLSGKQVDQSLSGKQVDQSLSGSAIGNSDVEATPTPRPRTIETRLMAGFAIQSLLHPDSKQFGIDNVSLLTELLSSYINGVEMPPSQLEVVENILSESDILKCDSKSTHPTKAFLDLISKAIKDLEACDADREHFESSIHEDHHTNAESLMSGSLNPSHLGFPDTGSTIGEAVDEHKLERFNPWGRLSPCTERRAAKRSADVSDEALSDDVDNPPRPIKSMRLSPCNACVPVI